MIWIDYTLYLSTKCYRRAAYCAVLSLRCGCEELIKEKVTG